MSLDPPCGRLDALNFQPMETNLLNDPKYPTRGGKYHMDFRGTVNKRQLDPKCWDDRQCQMLPMCLLNLPVVSRIAIRQREHCGKIDIL